MPPSPLPSFSTRTFFFGGGRLSVEHLTVQKGRLGGGGRVRGVKCEKGSEEERKKEEREGAITDL